jgi:hypothetical protein
MAITDYTTQLESVQAAIAAIEGGAQSVSWNGRSQTSADLKTLYDREKWLRKMVNQESRGGIRVRGVTPV